jgi:hypothetical protein
MVTSRSLERWVADNHKPAMPPARDAIDALLDAGATAASNAPKAPLHEADQSHGHAASSPAPSPAHTYAALDAKLKRRPANPPKGARSLIQATSTTSQVVQILTTTKMAQKTSASNNQRRRPNESNR